MRLLTFNASALPLLTPHVAERLRVLADEIRRLDPDVVCLQEIGLDRHARQLAARLPGWPSRFWVRRRGGLVAGGLAVFSKAPIASTAFEAYLEQGPWLGYSYLSRLSVKGFMSLRWDRPDFRLIHTHPMADFRVSRRTLTDYSRLQDLQLDQLLRRAHAWRRDGASGAPLAVAGDLNFGPRSAQYRRLVGELALHDLMGGTEDPSMVPEADFSSPPLIPRRLERLDYILLTQDGRAAPRRATFVLDKPYVFRGALSCLSDHRGVLGEFSLDGA